MAFTYDPSTLRGQVRLLISDKDEADAENQVFSDEEIDAFLLMEGDHVLLTAARALDVMATNQVMVLKVIRLLDLQTDGAKVAAELRAQAKELRGQSEEDGEFDYAEMVLDVNTLAERLRNEVLRG